MLKGGPEGLTQLDKLKMFRKVLAISHLITGVVGVSASAHPGSSKCPMS